MAVTSQELLALFSQASAVANSDQFLLHGAEGVSGNHAVKVTAEKVRAYLLGGVAVTIGQDGYWYIGGQSTGVKAEGSSPTFVRRNDGIYYTVDGGTSYHVAAYYTDFRNDKVMAQTLTTTSILPNVLNVWGSVQSLTITFIAGDVNDENEYKLQFQVSGSDFQLNLPDGVTWADEPEWTNGYIYQVSILNNLSIYAGWEAANT
jgi:hypothetical protein